MNPGLRADVVHEPALEGAHAEEPVPLFDLLDRLAALRATAVDEVLLRPVPLVGDAVPAPVRVLVEERAAVGPLSFLQLLEGDSHDRQVVGVGGADEAVVADLESVPLRLPHRREVVDVLLGREPARRGRALDLVPVLVGAGQESHVLPDQAPLARDGVGQDRRVRMADVRPVVDVVDRGRQVVAAHARQSTPPARRSRTELRG